MLEESKTKWITVPALNSKVIAINGIKKQQPHSGKELMLGILWIYLLYFWFECFNPITNTVMNKTTCHTMEECIHKHFGCTLICEKHTKSIEPYLVDIFIEFSLSMVKLFPHFNGKFTHLFCLHVVLFVCLFACVPVNNLCTRSLQN